MHLTAIFKLRVSRRKAEILDHALREYADLHAWLLAWAEENIDRLGTEARVVTKRGNAKFPARRVEMLLPPQRECPGEIHSSLKGAARADVAGIVAGYLALRKKGYEPGFPTSRSERVGDFIAALERLARAADVDQPTWLQLTGDLARKAVLLPPPLWFPRMDGYRQSRNAALLRDPERGKYFALLFLLPARHHLGQQWEAQGNLVPVGVEDPEPFTGRTRTAIICPLEFGEWHREKFLESGAVPKAAHLYRDRDGDYYLAVAFEMPEVKPVPLTGAVMAVVGSQPGLVAYAVVSPAGDVLEAGDYRPETTRLRALKADWRRALRERQRKGRSVEGFTLRRASRHTIHAIVNDLVTKAVAHGARIVVQAPGRQQKRRRSLPLAQIRAALEYKAELAGLPGVKWARMWQEGDGEWIHLGQVCATCGCIVPKGRPQETFTCPTCGERDFGVNLAMSVALTTLGG